MNEHRKYFEYAKSIILVINEELSIQDLIKTISFFIMKQIVEKNYQEEKIFNSLFNKLFHFLLIDGKLDEIANIIMAIIDKNLFDEHLIDIIIYTIFENKITLEKKIKKEKMLLK